MDEAWKYLQALLAKGCDAADDDGHFCFYCEERFDYRPTYPKPPQLIEHHEPTCPYVVAKACLPPPHEPEFPRG